MIADDALTADLADLYASSAARLPALRVRLAAAAEDADVLDVAYRTVDTPVGRLLLAATPAGLVRVAYPREGHDSVLQHLADRVSPRLLHAPARLDAAVRQFEEFFAGRRRGFDLALDRQLSSGFRRRVQETLSALGYGRTVSYAGLARLAGNPAAVRAAATACATNPLPVVVPCHRVIRSDGGPGRYLGGSEAKQLLLDLEAA